MDIPKIYPITDTRLSRLSHAEQVKRLIKGGANFIQLREKNLPPKHFYADALEAVRISRAENVKIIINDRVDIALAVKADGVHLGQGDFPPLAARKILGEKAIIGFSTHNLQQISEAIKMPLDYIAIGPIFETKTKENPDKIVGVETIKKIREIISDFALVAIGGINRTNFLKPLEAGADSVAIISDLLKFPEKMSENFAMFNKIVKQL